MCADVILTPPTASEATPSIYVQLEKLIASGEPTKNLEPETEMKVRFCEIDIRSTLDPITKSNRLFGSTSKISYRLPIFGNGANQRYIKTKRNGNQRKFQDERFSFAYRYEKVFFEISKSENNLGKMRYTKLSKII